MNSRHLDEIKGIVIIASGILLLLGLVSYTPEDIGFLTEPANSSAKNLTGAFGAVVSWWLFLIIGWAGYILPVILFSWGADKFRGKRFFEPVFKFTGLLLLTFSVSSFMALTSNSPTVSFARAGAFGFVFARFLRTYVRAGAWVITIALILLSSVLTMGFLVSNFILKLGAKFKASVKIPDLKIKFRPRQKENPPIFGSGRSYPKALERRTDEALRPLKSKEPESGLEKPQSAAIEITIKPNSAGRQKSSELRRARESRARFVQSKSGSYQLPSLDLLEDPPTDRADKTGEDDLAGNAHILEDTLADFGILVKVTNIERGPVITRYELEPAPGVKIQKIVSLGDDIALAMKAQSVRIVAPIPGKSRVGIEVPNTSTIAVYLKDVLSSPEFQGAQKKLVLALGKDITGKAVVSDLGEMPHLLIAGTTGSGKTVCVNSLILSILCRAGPEEVKFLMVDPKMVEMSVYNGLPHLICPVVTDAKKVSHALNWVVNEMEERYKLLAKAGCRNIESYNQKEEEKLPYIVVVIDELADLMAIAASHIESAITRLSQLSRAVGIHLILATQRPSVDVITGVIKANFPARISFKVASKVDSRTVLDANGADKLLGKGDLLFMRPGESRLIRAQGSLLKDSEIERVVNFIKEQAEPVFEEEILKEEKKINFSGREKDELFDDALRLVIETNQASVSILQRRLMLGYTRAARLIDAMEEEGFVGPYEGSKPRKILVDRQTWLKEHSLTPALDAKEE